MKYVLFFIAIVFIKIFLNLVRFLKLRYYHSIYQQWVESLLDKNKVAPNNFMNIKPGSIELLEKSNVTRPGHPHVELVGLGRQISEVVDVWDNMFVNNQNIILNVNQSFKFALAVHKYRLFQSFNPVYWVETILFLPRTLFTYLGLNADSFVTKLANLTWWIFGTVYAIYSENINSFIQDLISNFFK